MVPSWLSSSTHTFYKHRRDSSVNLVQHTVSHLSHHVTLSLHGLEAATVNSFLDSVTSLLFTEGRRGCKREGGRDKMKERDIERDTERNSERERMREREGWNETEEGEREREVGEGDRERERYRDRQ